MRLGVTETVDCAHFLPGHPKCGQIHGYTYKVEIVVEGETSGGMLIDFSDLRGQIRDVLRTSARCSPLSSGSACASRSRSESTKVTASGRRPGPRTRSDPLQGLRFPSHELGEGLHDGPGLRTGAAVADYLHVDPHHRENRPGHTRDESFGQLGQ